MHGNKETRDIIVIGASAGGVEALSALVRSLPQDLAAAVFIVLHVGATSHLAGILDRAGALPARHALSGDRIDPGRILVAPPGSHLLLHGDHVLLRRGPRENLARPAIDPLFRSAAASFGGRVTGVVLTGSMSDGSAGLRAIKRCGGVAVVQDPDDAMVPDMPRNALKSVAVDHTVPIAAMADLLVRLSLEPAGATPEIPMDIRMETAIAAQELSGMQADDELGAPSRFTCPECHGALWEINDGDILRYRCHVGHAYNADVVLEAKDSEAENTLWALLRSHQERAALARRMASREEQNPKFAERMLERATEYDRDAHLVRQIIASDSLSNAAEAGSANQDQSAS